MEICGCFKCLKRDTDIDFKLLDEVVEEIGENYIIQIVTDNEAAMKATRKKINGEKKPFVLDNMLSLLFRLVS